MLTKLGTLLVMTGVTLGVISVPSAIFYDNPRLVLGW